MADSEKSLPALGFWPAASDDVTRVPIRPRPTGALLALPTTAASKVASVTEGEEYLR
ncbi:hypothetical protein ACFXPQ_23560 [Streptomyces lydicus]|uniref:hypothetical protein n=1 Tax=Streptomyces lydicus TaxID=47763 RepID=UPI0036C9C5C6